MEKENVSVYNGILFGLGKDENSDLCYKTDEPWDHYTCEIGCSTHEEQIPYNFSVRGTWSYLKQPLHRSRESNMVGARDGRGELMFKGPRTSVWEDAKSSRGGWWCWLHISVNVLDATELHTYKWSGWYILCYVYFTTTKIRRNGKHKETPHSPPSFSFISSSP